MRESTHALPAFHGTTVVSTRKESAIEGAIVRRRQGPDGKRITTYEIDEAKAELLLTIPGGLTRRHTAINPDNITRAVELANSGMNRRAAEKQLGVSSGTFRRLLEAGGVETRRYTPVLTEDNVVKALKTTVKYDIRKRSDIIRASKEVGTDSRTLRRLLSRAFELFTTEQIAAIRQSEATRLQTPEGQEEVRMSKQPIARKPRSKDGEPGTSLNEPHEPGNAADAAVNATTSAPPLDPLLQPDQTVPPVHPIDTEDRTRPHIVEGGTHVEPIEETSDVDEQKAHGIYRPERDNQPVHPHEKG